MKYRYHLKNTFLFLGFLIIFSSSVLNLYEKKGFVKNLLINYRDKIVSKISNNENTGTNQKQVTKFLKPDIYWANELKNGGYILYMRHAKRDKWKDVALYDSAEAKLFKENKSLASYGETKYYSDAICLSNKGKIQAKMIREKLTEAEIPIKYVVSSPSCRARQTAVLSFGKHDQLNEVFFHRNIFNEFFKDWQVNLKQAFLNVPIIDGGNTVVTAHGGVIDKNLF